MSTTGARDDAVDTARVETLTDFCSAAAQKSWAAQNLDLAALKGYDNRTKRGELVAASVADGASVVDSAVLPGARVERGATVRDAVVGPDAVVGTDAVVDGGTVLGAGAVVEPGEILTDVRRPEAA